MRWLGTYVAICEYHWNVKVCHVDRIAGYGRVYMIVSSAAAAAASWPEVWAPLASAPASCEQYGIHIKVFAAARATSGMYKQKCHPPDLDVRTGYKYSEGWNSGVMAWLPPNQHAVSCGTRPQSAMASSADGAASPSGVSTASCRTM